MFESIGMGIAMIIVPVVVMIGMVIYKLGNTFRTVACLEGDKKSVYIRHTMREWFITAGVLILAGGVIWSNIDTFSRGSALSVIGLSLIISSLALIPAAVASKVDKEFCIMSRVLLTIGIILLAI